jgi:hypothetical protein
VSAPNFFVIPVTFTGNTLAVAEQVDTNFGALVDYLNGFALQFNATPSDATTNTTALTNALAAVAAVGGGLDAQPDGDGFGSGGRLWFAQRSYTMNASTNGLLIPDQSIVEASGYGGVSFGGASSFFHCIINGSGSSGTAGLIFMSLTGMGHTDGGAALRGLAFQGNSTNSTDMAVYCDLWNSRVIECTFKDTPVCVGLAVLPNGTGSGNGAANGASIDRCTIQVGFRGDFPDYCTSIWLTAEQSQIHGPSEFAVQTPNTFNSQVCISVGGGEDGSEHQTISGVHIDGYQYGIDYADINNTGIKSGALHTFVENCEIDCQNTAINMSVYLPTSNPAGHSITSQCFVKVSADKSGASTNGAPVWLIDTNSNNNNSVESVDMYGCLIYSNVDNSKGTAQPDQYGLQINGGGSIRMFGGKIGGLGTKAGGNDGTANVAITSSYTFPYNTPGTGGYPAPGIPPTTGSPGTSVTNGPDSVLLEGVDLRPNYVHQGSGSGPTQWALIVSGTQSGSLRFNQCDMNDFTGGGLPVKVTATFTGDGVLLITDCPGYNDQGTDINATVIPTSATSAQSSSTPYYGPSEILFQNGNTGGTTTLVIGGVSYTIPPGQFVTKTLAMPNIQISMSFSGGATSGNINNWKWKGR